MPEDAIPKKVTLKLLWIFLGVATVLWGVYWVVTIYFMRSASWSDRSGFGEMFGGINALFSAFAFAGLIFTILLQREELELQREELKQTRKELRGQKEQLEAQNKTFLLDSFETKFFQLVQLHHQIVAGTDFQLHNHTYRGRDCFTLFFREFRSAYEQTERSHAGETAANRIKIAYERVYPIFQTDLGHYFRNLYNLVKFIDGAPIEGKKFYTNILRAQLSSGELAILFYNCLSDYGNAKFKPLIEKICAAKTLAQGSSI